MEELKNLVGRTVKVYAYIGKKNERLSFIRGAIKSASATGIVLESLSEHAVITIQANKIMTISEWEPDTWKRVKKNAQIGHPKILWGNAHTFNRREEEIEKQKPLYYFIDGIAITLLLVVAVWVAWSLNGLTHGYVSSLVSLGLNVSNNTTSIANLLPLARSFNISGFNTNTNLLTANEWHVLTLYWSFLSDTLLYVALILGAGFLYILFSRPVRFFNEDFYVELRAYMFQKFDDELK